MTYNVRPLDNVPPDEDPGDYYVINLVPEGPILHNTLMNLGLSQQQTWHGTYYQSEIEFVFKEIIQQIVNCFDFNASVFVAKLKNIPVSVYFEHIPALASDRARATLKDACYRVALELYARVSSVTGIYSHFDVMVQSITIDNLTIYYANKGALNGEKF